MGPVPMSMSPAMPYPSEARYGARPVRSFVRREGRMTRGQRQALARLWQRYGVEPGTGVLDWQTIFGRQAPCMLEVGFGMGEALESMARAHPHHDYIGIEVYRPGIGALLARLEAGGVENVRLLHGDAVEIFGQFLAQACLDEVHVYFPDPWPKKRHHKRRLIQPGFAQLLAEKLRPGGRFYLATDWRDYAEYMMMVMSQAPGFSNGAKRGGFAPRSPHRPLTKFEGRGLRLGHGVWDLLFEKTAPGTD